MALGQEHGRSSACALRAQVPAGHKIAARRIAAGEPVKKYDTVIGAAARDIEAGELCAQRTTCSLVDFDRDPGFCEDVRPVRLRARGRARHVPWASCGPDGRVGDAQLHRHHVGSVNCSSTVGASAWPLTSRAEKLAAFPNIDGVAAFAQTSGCGMSSPSEHFDVLRRTLAGYARHPNLAGVLIVGLGCERNQVDSTSSPRKA